jgi:hypothetical protein
VVTLIKRFYDPLQGSVLIGACVRAWKGGGKVAQEVCVPSRATYITSAHPPTHTHANTR